jgi:hypothetical protein
MISRIRRAMTTVAGIAVLIAGLAFLAAVPGLNLIALGYLFDVEGRLARGGALSCTLPLRSIAARLGAIAISVWIWLVPLRLLESLATDAQWIDAGACSAAFLHRAYVAISVLIGAHLVAAVLNGGAIASFFRPVKNARALLADVRSGGWWPRVHGAIIDLAEQQPLSRWLSLGIRGFIGAFCWLSVPTTLLYFGDRSPLFAISGALLLSPVLAHLPFLEARFAAFESFAAFKAWREVRALARRAPLLHALAVAWTLFLTLPLYALKAFVLPTDAAWAISLFFVGCALLVRLVVGIAYARACTRRADAHWALVWMSRLAIVPVVLGYTALLFYTPWLDAHGRAGLFAQHAFLLPSPN